MKDRTRRTAYGPVLSRRFGLSVGIDLMDRKVCTYDCMYCQVGPTVERTVRREERVSNTAVLEDLKWTLSKGPRPDVVTLAGSGEPTLHRPLGELIGAVRNVTDVPVALLTNSSLLSDPEVAAAAMEVDILAPSLDAGDEEMFERINRPHGDVTFQRMLAGLRNLSHRYRGRLWLEVMLVKGINDSPEALDAIARCIRGLRADGIDINTPVRPVPKRAAVPCDPETLDAAVNVFEDALIRDGLEGARVRIISTAAAKKGRTGEKGGDSTEVRQRVYELLSRRPCTVGEMTRALGVSEERVFKALGALVGRGAVTKRVTEREVFYHAVPE